MTSVAVVTDSVAALPPYLAEQYDIHTVPILIYWDGKTYHDGVDITPGEVYQRLRVSPTLPSTSSPTVGDFVQTYMRLSREVDGIVSVHVSSELSATYQAALVAARAAQEVVPIRVVDSGTAAMGQGFAVMAAARAAAEGADLDQVAREAQRVSQASFVLAMLDTLRYLQRSGRVDHTISAATSALNIKPILYLRDHKVGLLAKPRTQPRAVSRMLKEMEKRTKGRPAHVAVMHADAQAQAKALMEEVQQRFRPVELFMTEFTPVMGGTAGPGLVGLAFYADELIPRSSERNPS